jgi:hypothetical protein
MAAMPHGRSALDAEGMVFKLLMHLGYLMDTEAERRTPENVVLRYSYRRSSAVDTVFMHSSGFGIVQVLDGGRNLLWSPNRIYCSRFLPGKQPANAVSPDKLLAQLCEYVNDAARLQDFWDTLEEQGDDSMSNLQESRSSLAGVKAE